LQHVGSYLEYTRRAPSGSSTAGCDPEPTTDAQRR
jgi:hypothetical protein